MGNLKEAQLGYFVWLVGFGWPYTLYVALCSPQLTKHDFRNRYIYVLKAAPSPGTRIYNSLDTALYKCLQTLFLGSKR